MDKNKTKDEIFAEALSLILENQIKIKVHFGLARSDDYYGDCNRDWRLIEDLEYVK